MNYTKAKDMFNNSRKRKLANNTYLESNSDGSYGIRLHQTQIIKFYPDKTVLDSGNYRTVTTKARINEFAYLDKWYLYQKDGIWYLATGPNIGNAFVSQFVFADGITYQNGSFTSCGGDPKEIQETRKQARQYAKDFTTALFAGEVPEPSNGDCWCCLLKDSNGQEVFGGDHILQHIKEKYYVPSLLVNAERLFPISIIAKNAIGSIWQGNLDVPMLDIVKRQIEKLIRRYCYRQLKTA